MQLGPLECLNLNNVYSRQGKAVVMHYDILIFDECRIDFVEIAEEIKEISEEEAYGILT